MIQEVISSLRSQSCVVLLGPELVRTDSGGALQEALLARFHEAGVDVQLELDGLFRCSDQNRTRAFFPLVQFFTEHLRVSPLFERLALIPAHLYVSMVPDRLLSTAMESAGIDHEFAYYVKESEQAAVSRPSRDQPLVYNLFGCIDEQASLVFTHDDLLTFLFSIIRDYQPPLELQGAVKKAAYFLFLGFDFDKWYHHLLLRIFGLVKGKIPVASEVARKEPSGAAAPLRDDVRAFYQEHFGMIFVEEQVDQWVKLLYEACDSEGILRQRAAPLEKQAPVDRLRELVARDLEAALGELQVYLDQHPDDELLDSVMVTHGELGDLEKDFAMGKITREVLTTNKARLREAALSYIRGLPG